MFSWKLLVVSFCAGVIGWVTCQILRVRRSRTSEDRSLEDRWRFTDSDSLSDRAAEINCDVQSKPCATEAIISPESPPTARPETNDGTAKCINHLKSSVINEIIAQEDARFLAALKPSEEKDCVTPGYTSRTENIYHLGGICTTAYRLSKSNIQPGSVVVSYDSLAGTICLKENSQGFLEIPEAPPTVNHPISGAVNHAIGMVTLVWRFPITPHHVAVSFNVRKTYDWQNLRPHRTVGDQPALDNFFRPVDGLVWVRLLPNYLTGTRFVSRRQHYITPVVQCAKLPDGKGNWHGECPICDYYQRIWKYLDRNQNKVSPQISNELRSLATRIKPAERYYYNVIVRGKQPPLPVIWGVNKSVHEQITRCDVAGEEFHELFCPWDGHDIKVIRRTDGRFPSYDVFPAHNPSSVAEDNVTFRTQLANVWDLEKVARSWEKSGEELRGALQVLLSTTNTVIHGVTCRKCNKPFDSISPSATVCDRAECQVANQATLAVTDEEDQILKELRELAS